ncbi:hypothetical protein CEXT_383291 [Caerostris extrusa]|uniref:Uncharacterized protein n=1 Tax=Caerostris extrusa TaxID=172846 RepID=A0AAV4V757_CAEEX|nr:hypothetical protein CEXT_383291 [Caerostris extrusa]
MTSSRIILAEAPFPTIVPLQSISMSSMAVRWIRKNENCPFNRWDIYAILGDGEKCLRFTDLKRAQQAAKVSHHDGGVVGLDHVETRSALLGLIKQQYRDTFIDKLAPDFGSRSAPTMMIMPGKGKTFPPGDSERKPYTILGDGEKCLRFTDLKRTQQAAKVSSHDGGVVGPFGCNKTAESRNFYRQISSRLLQSFRSNDDDYA